jgi:hypothetical protein
LGLGGLGSSAEFTIVPERCKIVDMVTGVVEWDGGMVEELSFLGGTYTIC